MNVDEWKEFEISKLFSYERGKESAPNQNPEGKCRLLSETQDNNGFVRLVEPTKIIKDHCLTVSVNYASTVFYQEDDFCASVNIIVLRPKIKMTKNQLLFIATILSKKHEAYSYNDKVSKDLLMNDKIKLPAVFNQEKNKYEPDWEYMEEFIKNAKEENEKKLVSLGEIKKINDKIYISDWHEFEIGRLFKKTSAGFKNQEPFKKEIHVSETKNNKFNLPLVNAKDGNNGIMYYGKKEDWDYVSMSIDIVSDGAISTGNVYPQIDDTSVLYNAYLIKLKNKYIKGESEGCLIFISTVMEKEIKAKYGYENKATWGKIAKEKIKLPAIYNQEKDEYEPDWEYMENFIKERQDIIKKQFRRIKND